MQEFSTNWLPFSIDAEQALLGAVLINNEVMPLITDMLRKEHFYEEIHGVIFEICERLIGAGKAANPVTLKSFLPNDQIVGEVTMMQYVARLARNATTIVNARDYANNIRDLALHREIINIGAEMQRQIPREIGTFTTEAIDAIDAVAAGYGSAGSSPPMDLSNATLMALDASAKAYQNEGKLLGLSWGLEALDRKTLGMHGGDLIVIAGRPGMGKTALALSLARNIAHHDGEYHPGLIFSMEMDSVSLSQRMLSDEMFDSSPLSYLNIRAGKFSEDQFDRMRKAQDRLAALPIHIDERGSLTVAQIAATARRRKRSHGLKWIMIDYLQLIKASNRYQGNRVQEVGEITSSLKALAKELKIPIVVLAQLSRAVESREDKRPTLGDLRESGNIEQDADLVIMLYRESYYVERSQPINARLDSEEHAGWQIRMARSMNKLDAIVEKQRQGPIGSVHLFCDISCNAVRNAVDTSTLPEML